MIALDKQARLSADSAPLSGSESGGGLSPRWVLRLFRTRNQEKQLKAGDMWTKLQKPRCMWNAVITI